SMASPILPDDLWQRLERFFPEQAEEDRHVQFAGRKPSGSHRILAGIISVLRTGIPWGWLPATTDFPSGRTCLRYLRRWRRAGIWQRIFETLLAELQAIHRSIGIAPWWIARQCGLRVEVRKQAQIPRIGASWEASIISSPMPLAFHWRSR